MVKQIKQIVTEADSCITCPFLCIDCPLTEENQFCKLTGLEVTDFDSIMEECPLPDKVVLKW